MQLTMRGTQERHFEDRYSKQTPYTVNPIHTPGFNPALLQAVAV